jgi:processing peptidase subunit beta
VENYLDPHFNPHPRIQKSTTRTKLINTEHLLFKGTSKRNRTQLEKEIEGIGGTLNAFTAREQTVFTTTVQKKHMPQAMEIMADVLQNSTLSEKAIENERAVILEELSNVQQDLQETVYDNMHKAAFRSSPLSYVLL